MASIDGRRGILRRTGCCSPPRPNMPEPDDGARSFRLGCVVEDLDWGRSGRPSSKLMLALK